MYADQAPDKPMQTLFLSRMNGLKPVSKTKARDQINQDKPT